MAAGTKLVLTFATADGESMNLTYNYAKPSTTLGQVQTLMNGIITAGEIFAKVPVLAKGAKLVTTTESEYDLNT